MLRIFFLAFSLLTALSTGAFAGPSPGQAFFDETFGNFQEELDQARADHKQGVLIFFQQADCPFCYRMETTVLNRPEVQDYYRKYFRIFSVDIEGDLEITDFQGHTTTQKDFSFKQYKVRATPVFAFFDLDGRLIARHTGPTRNAQEFLWLGEYVSDGHYRAESFARFKRAKQLHAQAE
jgi:thioredoxin-related protein